MAHYCDTLKEAKAIIERGESWTNEYVYALGFLHCHEKYVKRRPHVRSKPVKKKGQP